MLLVMHDSHRKQSYCWHERQAQMKLCEMTKSFSFFFQNSFLISSYTSHLKLENKP